MTRIEINQHLKELQKEYKAVSERDLSFEEWLTTQCLALASTAAYDLAAANKKHRNLIALFMDVLDQRIDTPDNGDCWWCGGSGVDPNALTNEYECRVCKTWHKEIV